MRYRRLKTKESTGTPILRYYKLAEGEEAIENAFYEIKNNVASKVNGTPTGKLIGFSHGGDKLAKGLIFLDINDFVVYMGILEDGDEKPNIGDVVNGYQKVIDTHYEAESAAGKNDDGFGVEYLDVPYYLFVIIQPTDGGAQPTEATITIRNIAESKSCTVVAVPVAGETETVTVTADGTYELLQKVPSGDAISTVYSSITVTFPDDDPQTVDTTAELNANTVYSFTTWTIPDNSDNNQ